MWGNWGWPRSSHWGHRVSSLSRADAWWRLTFPAKSFRLRGGAGVGEKSLEQEQNLRSMRQWTQALLLPFRMQGPPGAGWGLSFLREAQQWPSMWSQVIRAQEEQTFQLHLSRATVNSQAQQSDHSPRPPRLFCRSRHLKKMTEEFPTLPQGAEASLPLTGSAPCGMPSILRKMWTRHKKKSEYVGATNSAFEAD